MRPLEYQSSGDLTRTTLAVLSIVALIVFTAWIMHPFLSALAWATMIVISTWPLLRRIQARLLGKRGLATAVLTLALLLVLLIPLSVSVGALIGNVDRIVAGVQKFSLPPPPDWVARIPIEGPTLSAQWQRLASQGPDGLSAQIRPFVGRFLQWFVGRIGGVGAMILQFLLTVIISAVLYTNAEAAARGVRRFAYRLAGANGERVAIQAANTVRGVAMGVVVTAIIQTVIAGVGLVITAVPGAGLLIAASLILCLAQLGPTLVMLPTVIWEFYTGDSLRGFVLLGFMIIAGAIDNFLRPLLIRKSADLPLVLIFAGVIGGMIGFGIMGIFVGPVILAVTRALLQEWVGLQPETERDGAFSDSSTSASAD